MSPHKKMVELALIDIFHIARLATKPNFLIAVLYQNLSRLVLYFSFTSLSIVLDLLFQDLVAL